MDHALDPFAHAPPDVLALLRDSPAPADPDLLINPLSLDESRRISTMLQQMDVGRELGLIALDDANDSNPYCYISRGVARGMVVHFSHDPEPEIQFVDLAGFRRSLVAAIQERRDIHELRHEPLPPHKDQAQLADALRDLLSRDDDNAEFLLCLLVPLLAPQELPIIESLAAHSNFFVRQSMADFIERHPLTAHLAVAERLSQDRHPQVARPGKRALGRVRALSAPHPPTH